MLTSMGDGGCGPRSELLDFGPVGGVTRVRDIVGTRCSTASSGSVGSVIIAITCFRHGSRSAASQGVESGPRAGDVK
jgi:hypothetical protein